MNAHEFTRAVDLMSQAARRIDKEGGADSGISYGIRAIRTLAIYGAAFDEDANEDDLLMDLITDLFHAYGPSRVDPAIRSARHDYAKESKGR